MWYIVKKNWPLTDQYVLSNKANARYCGLGGDIWPIEQINDREAREIHEILIKNREFVDLSSGYSFMACLNLELAQEYLSIAKKFMPGCMLIGLEQAVENSNSFGFDYGNPNGGYSIIETEILAGDNRDVYINNYCLFPSISSMNQYINNRSDDNYEEIEYYEAISVNFII